MDMMNRSVSGPLPGQDDPQNIALRRARINRVLFMKRRHLRQNRIEATGPRLMVSMLIVCAIVGALFLGSAGAAFAYYESQLPLLDNISSYQSFQTTHIYDRNGKLLYQLYNPNYGRRTYVNYSDISPLLVQATVAAEDHTFWDNQGVDVQGTLRAALTDLQYHTV